MRTTLSPALVFWLSLLVSSDAFGVKTATWTHSKSADFAKGNTSGIVISSRGYLQLGPSVHEILKEREDVDVVNALAATTDGAIFAGTTPKGIIYKIEGKKAEPFATLEDKHIFSLLFTQEGHLLAGTGGKAARIFKIGGDGKAALLTELDEARYVWAMARGRDGAIFAATGPKGKLFKITPEGKADVLCQTKQKNLLCLAIDKAGLLYAGTDIDGLIYRIDPKTGKKFVLYDAPEAEISGITIDGEGVVYASTADTAAAKPGRPAAKTPAGKPAPPTSRPTTKPSRRMIPTSLRTIGRLVAAKGKTPAKRGTSKGNAVYRIDTSGFVTEIFRKPVIIFSLAYHDKALYIGTGNEGRIFKILPEEEEILSLARLKTKQAVSALVMPDGRLIIGTAGKAGVFDLSAEIRTKGTYTSPVLDANQATFWGRAEWQGKTPKDTKITLATRSGNVADEKSDAWDDWSPEIEISSGAQISSPNARFLQYRITLTCKTAKESPSLDSVKFFRMANNRAPIVKSLETVPLRSLGPKAASILQGADKTVRTKRDDYWIVKWDAADPNGDKLLYDLYFRQIDGSRWIRLTEDLAKGPKLWNTNTVSDGRYELKVVAKDSSDNPPGTELTGSRISSELLVDNAPPTVTVKSSRKRPKNRHRVEADVTDALSKIVSVRYSVNSDTEWTYVPARDDIYDSTSESVVFEIDDLDTGENRVAIRAEDDHGNVTYHTISIETGPE